MVKSTGKNLAYYLGLSWRIEVIRDHNPKNPGWVARVKELPGCITQSDTFKGLGEKVQDAMQGWIETALEKDLPIPEPQPDEEYSGKFVLRLPHSLHRQLAEMADREEVSLNTCITTLLARAAGETQPRSGLPVVFDIQPNPEAPETVEAQTQSEEPFVNQPPSIAAALSIHEKNQKLRRNI